MMGDNMKYKNPLLNFAHENPLAGAILVPLGIHVMGKAMAMSIRTFRHGNSLSGTGPGFVYGEDDILRTEAGPAYSASDRPTDPGIRQGEEIQPMTQSPPVRYDREYHESGFLSDPNYERRKVAHTETSVFAGLVGLHILR